MSRTVPLALKIAETRVLKYKKTVDKYLLSDKYMFGQTSTSMVLLFQKLYIVRLLFSYQDLSDSIFNLFLANFLF